MAKMRRKTLSEAAAEARGATEAPGSPRDARSVQAPESPDQASFARRGPAGEADPLVMRIRELRQEKHEVRPPAPKRLNVNLEPALYDAFQEACSRTGRKMSEVVRDLVEAFVRS